MKKHLIIAIIAFIPQTLFTQWIEHGSQMENDIHIQDIEILDTNCAWAVASSYFTNGDEALDFCYTTDGETWVSGKIDHVDAAGHTTSNISSLSPESAWVSLYKISGGGGGIYFTNNFGATWTHQSTAEFLAPSGFPNVVHMFTPTDGFCMGDPYGTTFEIYTTIDGGVNWIRVPEINIPVSETLEYGTLDNYCVVENTIWFGTNTGRVLKSEDKGFTWNVYETTLPYVSDVAFRDHDNGICIGAGLINTTSDGGITWEETVYDGLPRQLSIEVVPGTDIYITSEAELIGFWENNGASYSLNDGATWIDIDGDIGFTTIKLLSPTLVWGGGFNNSDVEKGLYKFSGDILLDIFNSEKESNISLAPNPAINSITISLNDYINGEMSLEIFNMIGEKVFTEKNIYTSVVQIDVANLIKGNYIVKINRVNKTDVANFIKL